jgi:Arc/MetJ-type ribon-helix-helix transcriptional regulator
MSIDVDQETQSLIAAELQAGRFHDAASLVGTALKHFLITRENLGYSRDEIDAMIAQATSSLERGEGSDGEEFFAELEREEQELRRQHS